MHPVVEHVSQKKEKMPESSTLMNDSRYTYEWVTNSTFASREFCIYFTEKQKSESSTLMNELSRTLEGVTNCTYTSHKLYLFTSHTMNGSRYTWIKSRIPNIWVMNSTYTRVMKSTYLRVTPWMGHATHESVAYSMYPRHELYLNTSHELYILTSRIHISVGCKNTDMRSWLITYEKFLHPTYL